MRSNFLVAIFASVLTGFTTVATAEQVTVSSDLERTGAADRPALRQGIDIRETPNPEPLQSFRLRASLEDISTGPRGLRGAFQTALGRDADWQAALLDVKVADRQVWRELLRFTPVVTGTLQTNHSSAADGSRPLDLVDRESYIAISASLPIWTSGSRYYGIKAARSRREALVYEAMAARDQASIRLIDTWIRSLTGARDLELHQNSIERLKRLRTAVVARQRSGFASSDDIAMVDANLAAARQTLSSIEGELEKANGNLKRLAGQIPDRSARIVRFDVYFQAGKQAFIERAHRNNPSLQAAASRYRTETYSTRSAMSKLLPSVNLTGEYRHYLESSRQAYDDRGLTVGVRLQVPLFDLSSVAETAAQKARKEAALYREVSALNAVETQIDELWSDRKATIAMRNEAERELAARTNNAAAALNRFRKGLGSLEDAIRAQSSLLTAQRTALQLKAQECVLSAQLLLISGQFTADMLSEN